MGWLIRTCTRYQGGAGVRELRTAHAPTRERCGLCKSCPSGLGWCGDPTSRPEHAVGPFGICCLGIPAGPSAGRRPRVSAGRGLSLRTVIRNRLSWAHAALLQVNTSFYPVRFSRKEYVNHEMVVKPNGGG